MRTHLSAAVFTPVLVAAALVGCSSGDEERTPTPSPASATASAAATVTVEVTPTATPTPTTTATATLTETPTPTETEAPTETATETPSATPLATDTPVPTVTPTQPIATEAPTQTAVPTQTLAPTPTAPPAPSGVVAEIRGFGYPYELHVAAGSTVTWINRDAVPHDVVAFDGSWGSAVFNEGQSYSYTFGSAGRYAYQCTVHPYMQAAVIVE